MARTRRSQQTRTSRTSQPARPQSGGIDAPQATASRPATQRLSRPAHALVIAAILILSAWAYWPALDGEFVYDDRAQIAENPLIQRDSLLWKGLTSDVWAFQGMQADRPRNYWRPAFVAALAVQFRAFGLEPRGWHAVNLALHAAVSVLAYVVLLQLGLAWELAAGVSWLFAAHPVHTQSVAWVSGLPDPLAGVFLLGSYACYLEHRRARSWPWRISALLLFVLALLSKESSVALVGVVAVTEWVYSGGATIGTRLRHASLAALPFVGAVALFVAARFGVLGGLRWLYPEAPGLASVLLTLPGLLLFYARQVAWPAQVGPVHPVRYVDASSLASSTPWLGLVGLAIASWVLWRVQRGKPLAGIGMAWLCFPLLPVLDTRVFQSELIAQDRYLYLPVLGALVALAACLTPMLGSALRRKTVVALALAASLLASAATRREAAHWTSDLALWEHAVEVDPTSAIAWSQLGDEYQSRGRLAESKGAFERALAVKPDLTAARVGLGIVAGKEERWRDVERYLLPVLARLPDHETALEQLGQAYQKQGQYQKAIELFEAGRLRVPAKGDLYAVNIAVLTAQAGRLAEATRQLEGLVAQVDDQADPGMLKAWWYLAELYRAQKEQARAREAYQRYLAVSSRSRDPHVEKLRGLASQSLAGLEAR